MAVEVTGALLSTRFSFCRGHTAAAAEDMATVAWMRVIDWKNTSCPQPALGEQPPSQHYDVAHRGALWWPYTALAAYERQIGRVVHPAWMGAASAVVDAAGYM